MKEHRTALLPRLVVGLCIVLAAAFLAIVLRIVTDAWEVRRLEAEQDARRAAAAPPSSPSSTRGIDNPAQWITADDYPAEAMRNGQQGTVSIGWQVDGQGRIVACRIEQSSGVESLDRAACAAIRRNGHYPPAASDASGLRSFHRRVVWRLPD